MLEVREHYESGLEGGKIIIPVGREGRREGGGEGGVRTTDKRGGGKRRREGGREGNRRP